MTTAFTPTFTASNGLELEHTADGHICGDVLNCYGPLSPEGVEAFREFFQRERDLELGRWRDPVNRDLVVYRRPEEDDEDGRAVRVLDDSTGFAFTYWEKYGLDGQGATRYEKGQEAASRYFEAHPAPKPWEEAESGEIWELIGADGLKQAWVRNGAEGWVSINASKVVYYDGKGATAGRRIWPEED